MTIMQLAALFGLLSVAAGLLSWAYIRKHPNLSIGTLVFLLVLQALPLLAVASLLTARRLVLAGTPADTKPRPALEAPVQP